MSGEERQEIEAVKLSGNRQESTQVRLGQSDDHWHLHAICIRLPTDCEPYGYRVWDGGGDCSCGCIWFLPLQALPMDWGCAATLSPPRCG